MSVNQLQVFITGKLLSTCTCASYSIKEKQAWSCLNSSPISPVLSL